MRKGYIVTSILAILLLISLASCSGNSVELNKLEDDLAAIKSNMQAIKNELTGSFGGITGIRADIGKLETVLKNILRELERQREIIR